MHLPIEFEAHTFFETQLDAEQIREIAAAVDASRRALGELGADPSVVSIHAALRPLVGAPVDEQVLLDMSAPGRDFADILFGLLRDYAAALHRLREFAVGPVDPAAEYARLMGEAEKALGPYSSRSDGPARAEAYARLALIRRDERFAGGR